jgi:hypothetical protein
VPHLRDGPDDFARDSASFFGHIARDDATPRERCGDVDRRGVRLGRARERVGEATLRGRFSRACEHDDPIVRLREELEDDGGADEARRSSDEMGPPRWMRDPEVEGGLKSRLDIDLRGGSILNRVGLLGFANRLAPSNFRAREDERNKPRKSLLS